MFRKDVMFLAESFSFSTHLLLHQLFFISSLYWMKQTACIPAICLLTIRKAGEAIHLAGHFFSRASLFLEVGCCQQHLCCVDLNNRRNGEVNIFQVLNIHFQEKLLSASKEIPAGNKWHLDEMKSRDIWDKKPLLCQADTSVDNFHKQSFQTFKRCEGP